jgi:hypothetical protein
VTDDNDNDTTPERPSAQTPKIVMVGDDGQQTVVNSIDYIMLAAVGVPQSIRSAYEQAIDDDDTTPERESTEASVEARSNGRDDLSAGTSTEALEHGIDDENSAAEDIVLSTIRLNMLTAEFVEEQRYFKKNRRAYAEYVLRQGHRLIEIEEIVGYGKFEIHVRTKCHCAMRTAYSYKALAKSGMSAATIAEVGIAKAEEGLRRHILEKDGSTQETRRKRRNRSKVSGFGKPKRKRKTRNRHSEFARPEEKQVLRARFTTADGDFLFLCWQHDLLADQAYRRAIRYDFIKRCSKKDELGRLTGEHYTSWSGPQTWDEIIAIFVYARQEGVEPEIEIWNADQTLLETLKEYMTSLAIEEWTRVTDRGQGRASRVEAMRERNLVVMG